MFGFIKRLFKRDEITPAQQEYLERSVAAQKAQKEYVKPVTPPKKKKPVAKKAPASRAQKVTEKEPEFPMPVPPQIKRTKEEEAERRLRFRLEEEERHLQRLENGQIEFDED